MITGIIPKLPMRNKVITKDYYVNKLGFISIDNEEYAFYLILQKDNLELHFFDYKDLNTAENYGQVYIRVNDIESFYQSLLDKNIPIHPNGYLQAKPWGQKEFALLDPDHNLLTFGQKV